MSPDELNPYEVLQPEPDSALPGLSNDMSVDGSTLWVRPLCTLPARCIYTNQPGAIGDYEPQQIAWKGRSFQLKLREETVVLNCVISPAMKRVKRIRKWFQLLPTVVVFTLLLLRPSGVWLVAACVIPGLMGVAVQLWARNRGYSELKIEAKRDGFFQVNGMGVEFLASIEAELDAQQAAGHLYQAATLPKEPFE